MNKKLLLSALLAVSVASTQVLAQEVSDNELDEISAQGYQFIDSQNAVFQTNNTGPWKGAVNDQNNNLDSVQMNGTSMADATIGGAVSSSNSSVNQDANFLQVGNVSSLPANNIIPVDLLDSDGTFRNSFEQLNGQTALNHINEATSNDDSAIAGNINKQTQHVVINNDDSPSRGGDIAHIIDMDNNNNSVQLNDSAQMSIEGINIVNASTSAANAGYNVFTSGSLGTGTKYQENTQEAQNFNNIADGSTYALATNAEVGEITSAIDTPDEVIDTLTNGVPTQKVVNGVKYNYTHPPTTTIENNNNNNNSVQLNTEAQASAKALFLSNIAKVADNIGANFASVDTFSGNPFEQYNDQRAGNHMNSATSGDLAIAANINKETQYIENMTGPFSAIPRPVGTTGIIGVQNNNNNSVQLNDSAQMNATAFLLQNGSNSAMNNAFNLLNVKGNAKSDIYQENMQEGYNFGNYAEADKAVAVNGEFGEHVGQEIINAYATITDVQNNNNNSVQLNSDAQSHATFFALVNSANSTVNMAANLLMANKVSANVEQINNQTASNHDNIAEGDSFALAANLNKETQIVKSKPYFNLEGTQNNNNNSVQLNGNAQMNATGMFLVNAANSAVNSGINLMYANTVTGATITQTNTATASNWNNTASGTGLVIAGNAENISF